MILRGPLLNGILCFCACTNPTTLFLSKNIRAMRWYHDGAERMLGSKSLENELFWTIVNVLVVSPVIQRFDNCMWCYNFNISVRTNYQINICTSSNECSIFIQEAPVTHLQQSKITPLASQSIATSKFRPWHVA